MAHSEELCWCVIFLESLIVGMTVANPDLTDDAMILIILWELSVGVSDLSIDAEANQVSNTTQEASRVHTNSGIQHTRSRTAYKVATTPIVQCGFLAACVHIVVHVV